MAFSQSCLLAFYSGDPSSHLKIVFRQLIRRFLQCCFSFSWFFFVYILGQLSLKVCIPVENADPETEIGSVE